MRVINTGNESYKTVDITPWRYASYHIYPGLLGLNTDIILKIKGLANNVAQLEARA